ncbi:hypothetical protein KKI24_08315 [bacterium]|nr:hypothetical protein [bacterium]
MGTNLTTPDTIKPTGKKPAMVEYANIPEYNRNDSVNNRLVALVRLEQFMDEKSFTPGVIDDLETIAETARNAGEARIQTIAELILKQSRKYLTK